ncbi:hypothetical protein HPB50_026793 [Hyalomma asiaticum]|uniref:Uncharacterized protein n=1 Tax=Hyalomma asiaticum TaxID=266040 RepID=A0ACB7TRW9_HYAAI|nr:hypothetical protein HPB50_026793 [Hyalomma asiaticum]
MADSWPTTPESRDSGLVDAQIISELKTTSPALLTARVRAETKRFVDNCRSPTWYREGALSAAELQEAQNIWQMQMDTYAKERAKVEAGERLDKMLSTKHLNPFVDKKGATSKDGRPDLLATIHQHHSMAGQSTLQKKQGVSGESATCRTLVLEVDVSHHPKDFRSKQLIKDAIMENDFLKNLDSSQVREVVDCMYPQVFDAGTLVIREGDVGSHLYVSAGKRHVS